MEPLHDHIPPKCKTMCKDCPWCYEFDRLNQMDESDLKYLATQRLFVKVIYTMQDPSEYDKFTSGRELIDHESKCTLIERLLYKNSNPAS